MQDLITIKQFLVLLFVELGYPTPYFLVGDDGVLRGSLTSEITGNTETYEVSISQGTPCTRFVLKRYLHSGVVLEDFALSDFYVSMCLRQSFSSVPLFSLPTI